MKVLGVVPADPTTGVPVRIDFTDAAPVADDRAAELDPVIRGRLNAMRVADERIGDVRGRGARLAIELVDPLSGSPDADLAERIVAHAHVRGVTVATSGPHHNVIAIQPPPSIDDDMLVLGLRALAAAVRSS
jgi:4-aminobutyrate aminotransferase / (S)-3-amino-2-methylpropionate transaminase / 5-aminovalerate transaminase